MNILFLDMDGVLNCWNFVEEYRKIHGDGNDSRIAFRNEYAMHGGHSGFIVPELVDRLKRICRETGCKIVWSSSWRENYLKSRDSDEFDADKIKDLWEAKGLPFENFIGCTEVIALRRYSYVPRYAEIEKWIEQHASSDDKIAVLDDDIDAWNSYNDNENVCFFCTDYDTGLTEELTESIIRYFTS